MITSTKQIFKSATASRLIMASESTRQFTTQAKAPKKEGDISSVFVSLSGATPTPLPERFTELKRVLIHGNEDRVLASWQRLLKQLAHENELVALHGPNIIPQIDYADLSKPSKEFLSHVKKRGVAVVRGVVP
jgi:hypothetical protein